MVKIWSDAESQPVGILSSDRRLIRFPRLGPTPEFDLPGSTTGEGPAKRDRRKQQARHGVPSRER